MVTKHAIYKSCSLCEPHWFVKMAVQFIFRVGQLSRMRFINFFELKKPFQNCSKSKETVAYVLIQIPKVGRTVLEWF